MYHYLLHLYDVDRSVVLTFSIQVILLNILYTEDILYFKNIKRTLQKNLRNVLCLLLYSFESFCYNN